MIDGRRRSPRSLASRVTGERRAPTVPAMSERERTGAQRRGPLRLAALARRPPAQRSAFEQRLRDEYVAVIRRRREAGLPRRAAAGAPLVGLALSGGGVRSATFSFGVLRGLATRKLLTRIDMISTVSGGGYIGGMLGRLVGAVGIVRAQELLANAPSEVLDWLRRNGRYLTPAGSRDIGIAIVTFLRAAIAIHGEVMFALLPLALFVVAPHVLQRGFGWLDAAAWEPWGTLWWPIAALWASLTLPGTMAAYWVARDGPNPGATKPGVAPGDAVLLAGVGAIAAAATALAIDAPPVEALRDGIGGLPFIVAALWSLAGGIALTLLGLRHTPDGRALAVARQRNRLTYALRRLAGIALGLAAIGALDLASWWLLVTFSSDRGWLWGGLGLGGLAAVVLRALANPIQQLMQQAGQASADWGPKLLNLAGLAVALSLLLFWLTAVQWLVFAPAPIEALAPLPAWLRWSLMALLAVLWWALGAGHQGMANASSLHSFYRARLTRAYLAVGNPGRGLVGATVPADDDVRNVTEVVKGDDIELTQYRPDKRGGPLHLVNACLNQTLDDASGLYNADRKGTLVTATASGIEIGACDFVPWADADRGGAGTPSRRPPDVGTLGRWIAVSGAAAAPGAGSYTSRGWALLLFLLGVRLGHWMRSPLAEPPSLPAAVAFAWRRLTKPLMLWSEATATFVGRARPWWYLSDGGHFENSGVYALLKRECDFVILADCSADASYRFADIENLVRKARIDLDAEIEFYPRGEAAGLFTLAGPELCVLSPEDLIDNTSARGVLLARIRYRRSDPADDEHHATLLVIKPNLHAALDVDLLAYAQRRSSFPHESTGDQSFDEAQWESYHRLGEDLGGSLHETWLAQLPGWRARATHRLVTPARLRVPAAAGEAVAQREPAWWRSARATAIGTTLGLGASGTLLLSLWQVQETLQRNETTAQSELRQLFTEVSRDLRDLDGSCPKVADHTVMQVALLRDLSESSALLPIEQQSIARLVERIRGECERVPSASRACGAQNLQMQQGLCISASKQLAGAMALSYWQPLATPADEVRTWVQAWALLHFGGDAAPTSVTAAAGDSTTSAAGLPAPPPAPTPVEATTRPIGGSESPAAGSGPPTSGAEPTTSAGAAPPSALAEACSRDGAPVRLYLQVHDDSSREPANRLRDALLEGAEGRLQIAPIENVARSAELKQQRKPVPWPQPTFVVHDAALLPCARAIAPLLRPLWPMARDSEPWISELPASLKGQPRVIELWLPPPVAAPAAAR